MQDVFITLLKAFGALGLFVYGMKLMSSSVQRAAGHNLRKILNTGTSSNFKSIVTGFLSTVLIQSSSATTVMIVSFVNAGIVSLRKSIGLIMGANIGTTVKIWLIASIGYSLQTEDLALLIIVPASFFLLSNNSRVKPWGDFLFGLSILLVGLFLLKELFPEISKNTKDLFFLKDWSNYGYLSVLIFLFLGFSITVVLQSSSSAIAITILLSQQGIINIELAAAMILGENIGTTITANIAAILGNKKAKQAARIHFLFNFLGVLMLLPFLFPCIHFIQNVIIKLNFNTNSIVLIPFILAGFHSFFNIVNTVIQINFITVLEKLSLVLIKNRTLEEASLTSELLTDSLRETPEIAVLEIERHVLLFTDTVAKLPSVYQKILLEQDPKLISELLQYFSNFTLKSEKFKNELSRIVEVITEQELSLETSKKIRNLVTTSTQLEEIAKIFEQLVITFIRKKEEQIWFSPDQRIEVQRILGMLNESFVVLFKNLNTDNQKLDMREALAKKNEVEAQREYMRLAHFKEAEDGMLSVKNTLIYTEIYTACTRISEEIFTITEYLVGCDVTSRGIRFK